MPRTVEQIEADIEAVKRISNWITNEAALNAFTALVTEKNLLNQVSVPPPAGK